MPLLIMGHSAHPTGDMMGQTLRFIVPPSQGGTSLLPFLLGSGQLKGADLSRILKLGGVFVNRRRTKLPAIRLKAGDKIEIHVSELRLRQTATVNIPLSILHEGEDVIVVNKTAGLPVSSTRQSDRGHLLSVLQAHIDKTMPGKREAPPRARLVHRLDREVTGTVAFAISREAAANLSKQIQIRQATRIYAALVVGGPDVEKGVLSHRLTKGKVAEDGVDALTSFQVLSRSPTHTLLALKLQTGRYHQIRAQLSIMGWPILGDIRYGAPLKKKAEEKSPWLALHAWQLHYLSPEKNTPIEIKAPLPPQFVANLNSIGLTFPDRLPGPFPLMGEDLSSDSD